METGPLMPKNDAPDALPVELLHRIARLLSTKDLCALRLSCRAIERKLFHSFSREFFSRKQFMMSEFSLQVLVDIALHPNLSKILEHVSFGLEMLGKMELKPNATAAQGRLYQRAVADQSTLFSSGRAVDMLTEAFANLPNLKTISIRDTLSATRFRDFNSGHKHWNSYGYPTLMKRTGTMTNHQTTEDRTNLASHVFSAAMAALAKSGARPENIEVILRSFRAGLPDASFWLSPRTSDSYSRMLAGLRKLHLDIILKRYPEDLNVNPRPLTRMREVHPEQNRARMQTGVDCCNFIGHTAQSLEWLRINFRVFEKETADDFMKFFTNPTASPNEEDVVVFSKLKQLDLGQAHVSLESLCAMLQGLPSIETLCLHRIGLVSKRASEPGQSKWQTLLRKLPIILPKLRQLEVDAPCEVFGLTMHQLLLDSNGNHFSRFTVQVKVDDDPQKQFESFADKLTLPPAIGDLRRSRLDEPVDGAEDWDSDDNSENDTDSLFFGADPED